MQQARIEGQKSARPWGSLPYEIPVPMRPESDGTKMPGGNAIHMSFLKALHKHVPLSSYVLLNTISTLRINGVTPGVHQGYHEVDALHTFQNTPKSDGSYPIYNDEKSGCGLADGIRNVAENIILHRDQIKKRIIQMYKANPALQRYLEKTTGITTENFETKLGDAYSIFDNFDRELMLPITGPTLIETAGKLGAAIVNVVGEHDTTKRFYNIKEGVTFDKIQARLDEKQAFNVDLPAVLKQAEIVDIDPQKALLWTMIISEATAIALSLDQHASIHSRRARNFPEITAKDDNEGNCIDDRVGAGVMYDIDSKYVVIASTPSSANVNLGKE